MLHHIRFILTLSGSGPIAPPRSIRKSKSGKITAEPSPAPSRSGTLPRKPASDSNPMLGRPLPPPPPTGPRGATPPPALPAKSASVSQMAMGQMSGHRPQPTSIPMPAGGQAGYRRSGPGQYPQHQQYPLHQQQQQQYPQQQQLQQHFPPQQQQYPQNSSIYPQQEWNRAQTSAGYFEEMNFVPKVNNNFCRKSNTND